MSPRPACMSAQIRMVMRTGLPAPVFPSTPYILGDQLA
jgi:hypothetical protein